MLRRCGTVLAALLVPVLHACGPGGSPRVTVRDSAGVEIVESVPPAPGAGGWAVDSAPLVDIGADQDDPRQQLTRPTDPVRLAGGRIAVGDNGSLEIRVFDADGRWVGSIGRKGSGPGEFTDLRALWTGPGDTLYAYQGRTGQVSVLDAGGRFARAFRPEFSGERRFAVILGPFSTGHWLVNGSAITLPTTSGLHRGEVTLYRFSPDGRKVDSLTTLPGAESMVEASERGLSIWLLPYARASVTVAAGSRAYAGPTERVDLQVYREGAGLERIVRLALAPRPLTREIIAAAIARQLEGMSRQPPEARELTRRKLEGAAYPEQVPAIDRLTVAENGDLWLRIYPLDPGDPTRFAVTDSAGRFRAWVDGPPRFTPSWIGHDRILGLWRDPDDVFHVRMYPLRRG